MNDKDLMNIADEVIKEMEVDIIEEMGDESSDEDQSLSDDSDCISEDLTEKIVTMSQINALNGHTKQYAIYFYYSTGGAFAVCASCTG